MMRAGIKGLTARHYARAGRYAFYNPTSDQFEARPGVRPGNQNTRKVVNKSADLIERRIPSGQRRDTTRAFLQGARKRLRLSDMNAGEGLHMAHGRSVDELKQTGVAVLNAALKASPARRQRIAEEFGAFAAGWISSDAEDAPTVRTLARAMATSRSKATQVKAMDKLLPRFNRVSRNLVGADPKKNIQQGSAQDLPLQRDGKVFPHAEVRSLLLNKLQRFLEIPHERINREAGGALSSSTMNYT